MVLAAILTRCENRNGGYSHTKKLRKNFSKNFFYWNFFQILTPPQECDKFGPKNFEKILGFKIHFITFWIILQKKLFVKKKFFTEIFSKFWHPPRNVTNLDQKILQKFWGLKFISYHSESFYKRNFLSKKFFYLIFFLSFFMWE